MAKIESDNTKFIFRGCIRRKDGLHLKGGRPFSYTTVREHILKAVASIGENPKQYGAHSLRRDGATFSARFGVKDRLFKKHGRWKSDNATHGYIEEGVKEMLSVSKNLGI